MGKLIVMAGIVGLVGLVGCKSAGMGEGVRTDITSRMTTVRDPVAACYEAALKRNRKLKGTMVVRFTAAPKTGKFEGVQVVRDDLGDPTLATCVTDEVGKLALAAPQSTAVAATYPFEFAPSN